jgi:hypothetical protein
VHNVKIHPTYCDITSYATCQFIIWFPKVEWSKVARLVVIKPTSPLMWCGQLKIFHPTYMCIIHVLDAQHPCVKKWTHEIINFMQILNEPMKLVSLWCWQTKGNFYWKIKYGTTWVSLAFRKHQLHKASTRVSRLLEANHLRA